MQNWPRVSALWCLVVMLFLAACGNKVDVETGQKKHSSNGLMEGDWDTETGRNPPKITDIGKVFRDCEECPEMIVVPAGSFVMGSPESEEGRMHYEGPVHQVTIPRPIGVGIFEVTFQQWDACIEDGGCSTHRPGDNNRGRGNLPVVNVNWHDCAEYTSWLSEKTGYRYRMLSEAEWEYSARAGTVTPFYTGESISTGQANFAGHWIGETSRFEPLAVGSLSANDFGLYDMHGNVTEWVLDCWNESYVGAPTDGSGWQDGDCSSRVLRGGSYADRPAAIRSALRVGIGFRHRAVVIGFRVARDLPMESSSPPITAL